MFYYASSLIEQGELADTASYAVQSRPGGKADGLDDKVRVALFWSTSVYCS